MEKKSLLYRLVVDGSNTLIFLLLLLFLLVLLVPFILLYLFFKILYGLFLGLLTWKKWRFNGKQVIFVYSDSPTWKEYLEEKLLPKIKGKAIILNWSEHSQWNQDALEVQVFNHWASMNSGSTHSKRKPSWREFCPMAIVLNPWWKPPIIRFWQAFKEYKHGKDQELKERESELLSHL